jgi:hypothetical protein
VRRLTENIITALDRNGIFESHDVNHGTALVPNVDMVTKIDTACLGNAGLDHRSGFPKSMGFGRSEVGQIDTLIVDRVDVVVKVEEIVGHAGQTASRCLRCKL